MLCSTKKLVNKTSALVTLSTDDRSTNIDEIVLFSDVVLVRSSCEVDFICFFTAKSPECATEKCELHSVHNEWWTDLEDRTITGYCLLYSSLYFLGTIFVFPFGLWRFFGGVSIASVHSKSAMLCRRFRADGNSEYRKNVWSDLIGQLISIDQSQTTSLNT